MRLAIFLVVAACIGWSFPAFAATFTVDSTVDAVDAVPGDGFCADSGGACTLRAAVMETNVLPGEDSVVLPSGVYVLTSVASGALAVTGELVVAGAGAGQTAIEYVWQVSGVVGPGRLTLRDVTATAPNGIAFSVSGAVLEVIRSRITDAWVGILAHADSNVLVIDSEISRSAGGIVLLESTGGLVNSTVSEHQPVCRPKDGCSGGQAIYLAGSSLSMVNSSVAENGSAIVGDGVLTLAGTVIPHCDPALSVTSYGYNISSDGSCGLTDPTDQPNTDPMLGPLQDNGGPTWTHALLPGSPAIDAIPRADCTWDDDGDAGTPEVPLTEDQRGISRPRGSGCDIGAFERAPSTTGTTCGIGPELAVLLPVVGWARRRARRSRLTTH